MFILNETSEKLLRHVVPIFHEEPNGKLHSRGTGFLVEFNNNAYLVTAAHVLDSVDDPRSLAFYSGRKTVRNLLGSTRMTTSHKGDHSDDRLDVGVVKLGGSGSPPYLDINKEAISFSQLKPAESRKQEKYLITGFPGSKSGFRPDKKEMISKSYSPLTKSIPSPDGHDGTRIELFFDKNRVYGAQGQRMKFPNPEGMSGSPVWLVENVTGSDAPSCTLRGVLIEHHADAKKLMATNISVAIDIICNGFD